MKLTEKQVGKFVSLFNRNGYVLNFSTAEFDTFTYESVGVPLCQKYNQSKGRSLIAYLADASDEQKVKLLSDLLEYYEQEPAYSYEHEEGNGERYGKLYRECRSIIESLTMSASVVQSTNILKEKFSSDYLSKQISQMVDTQEKNPTDAIGKAKELIESCCKTILEERGIKWEKDWDVNKPSGQAMLCLGLMPESVDEKQPAASTAKALLGNLQQVALRMAELRNPYGTGHGKSASFKALPARYARLAVGASVTLVRFLWDTHEERNL